MVIGPITSNPPTYFAPPVGEKNIFEDAADQFFGFFKWLGGWIENGFKSNDEPPKAYELTPEQKTRIQELYLQSLEILKNLEQPGQEDEVKEFRRLLLEFYRNRSKVLKDESVCHYQSFEFCRKQVKESQEKERAEFEKLIEDSKMKDFWSRLTGAVTPIFTGVMALALPPGLNVAVIAVCVILAIEELSDHTYTKTIAEMSAPDDRQQQELLESRLQMGSQILSFAMAIPVGFNAPSQLAIAFGVAKATTGAGEVATRMSVQGRQGNVTQLTNQSEKNLRKLNDQLKSIQATSKSEQHTTEMTLNMIEAQRKAMQIRGG